MAREYGNNRQELIALRLTKEEKAAIVNAAQKTGKSASELLRDLAQLYIEHREYFLEVEQWKK